MLVARLPTSVSTCFPLLLGDPPSPPTLQTLSHTHTHTHDTLLSMALFYPSPFPSIHFLSIKDLFRRHRSCGRSCSKDQRRTHALKHIRTHAHKKAYTHAHTHAHTRARTLSL